MLRSALIWNGSAQRRLFMANLMVANLTLTEWNGWNGDDDTLN